MRGMSSVIASRRQRPKTGSLWPCVSACRMSGCIFEMFFMRSVENVNRLPHAAGDEAGEERDICIGDVMIGDAAVSAVPRMWREPRKVVFPQLHVAFRQRSPRDRCPSSLGRSNRAYWLMTSVWHRGLSEFPGVDMLRVKPAERSAASPDQGRGAPSGRDRGNSRNRTR